MALVLTFTLLYTFLLFFGSSAFDLSSLLRLLPKLKVQNLDVFQYNAILIRSNYFDEISLVALTEKFEFYDFYLSFGHNDSKMVEKYNECKDTILEMIAMEDLQIESTDNCSSRSSFIKDDCKSFLIYSDYEVCLHEEIIKLKCLPNQPIVYLYENLTQILYEIQIPMRKAVKLAEMGKDGKIELVPFLFLHDFAIFDLHNLIDFSKASIYKSSGQEK